MNIIWAIRELCVGEKGIENLFDREKSYQKLIDLSDNKNDAIIFTTLLSPITRLEPKKNEKIAIANATRQV